MELNPGLSEVVFDLRAEVEALKTRIKGELKTKIIAEENTGIEVVRKGSSIRTTAKTPGQLMTLQIVVTALFQTCLGDTFLIEKADHIGKQFSLGVNPMEVGLKVHPTNASSSDGSCCFWIQPFQQLDPGGTIADLLKDRLGGHGQKGCQAISHISWWANVRGIVAGKVEVTGVEPEAIALFIESDEPSGAIHDRSAYAKWLSALGLYGPGTGFKLFSLEKLQPGHPSHQADQPNTQKTEHQAHSSCRHGLQGHNPSTGR